MNRSQVAFIAGVVCGVGLTARFYYLLKARPAVQHKQTPTPKPNSKEKVTTILTDCPYEIISVKVPT